ncbi:hypothetical protein AN618_16990 [Fervidicola ferrireducens]|uniref:Prepilin-type N-terminal cleavage/methylation domain-containing protein n=2 Tax=Fervidicola ferrireducens TaxID=520764 RepID=A0A140L652_9FIRM|nr:hypothetical protein AN618_16990 [Fervidicola ferrireducens]
MYCRKNNKTCIHIKGSGGFTLIEVLLAALIITTALVPIMDTFVRGALWTAQAEDMIVALNLAQSKLEELKNRPYDDLEAGEPLDPGHQPEPFPDYQEYSYRITVSESSASGRGENNIKTVMVTIYDTATGRKIISLTMDKGDWR